MSARNDGLSHAKE